MLHGKEFGRSLSVETIHSLLPIFLAQVLHSHQLELDHGGDEEVADDPDDEGATRCSNIDLNLFTRTSDPMRQSEFYTKHGIFYCSLSLTFSGNHMLD